LTGRFREEHKGTPKLFLYMPYWAQGRSDEHLLVDWVGYIRRTMDRPIRQDSLPPGEVGTTVRMITVPDLEVKVQLEHAERYGVMTPVDNIVPLAQARRDMAAAFPTDDAYISKFLEPFVRPNCVFDAELTGESRERLAASLVVAVNYAAGDKVVKAGQVIDAKTVAALDALRNQLPEPAASEPLVTPAPVPKESRDWVWMVLAGTGGGGFVLISYLLLARRKSPQSSALVSKGNSSYTTSLSATDGGRTAAEWVPDRGAVIEGETERGWRERALAAESRAEKARELARTKVTDALKDKVVQHLSSQRDELIDDQLSAAEQMVGMEARLEKIQGPLSERLQAYEARIAELEDQLAIKDQENRALIQAKLENIRDQIARAKAARSFEWN